VREDGRVKTVRVLGIDTPETKDPRKPVQCFGLQASLRAHQLLDRQTVRLEGDPTQDTVDKYGRTLAYVWLPDGRLFQQVMLSEGFAHEYTYSVPYLRQAQFKAAQADARANRRGLWSPTTCNGNTNTPAGAAPPPPAPTTAAPAPPSGTVHPGSFCRPQGARGVTTRGTPMVCAPARDGRLRWRSG
jgi:micrococcal nuclease